MAEEQRQRSPFSLQPHQLSALPQSSGDPQHSDALQLISDMPQLEPSTMPNTIPSENDLSSQYLNPPNTASLQEIALPLAQHRNHENAMLVEEKRDMSGVDHTSAATVTNNLPTSIPQGRAGGAPTRIYMNERIVPYLLEGMKAVAKDRPSNPLRVLGEFLIQKSNEVEEGPVEQFP